MTQNEQTQGNLPKEIPPEDSSSSENLPVSTGKNKTPLNVSETEKILQNMQRMIDERQSGLNTILGALKDATAWAGGGIHGPTATLAARDRQRQLEQKELMDMQMEMARFRSQEERQREFAKEQAGAYIVPGESKLTAGEAKQISGTPDVSIEEGQVLYKGYPIDRGTAMLMKGAQSREARDKIFENYVSEFNKKRLGFEFDPGAQKQDITMKVPDGEGGYKLEKVNARTAKQVHDISRRNNISMEQAADIFFGGARPSAAAAPSAPAPTVGGGVTPAAVKQVESGGREGLVSRAGAQGVMQVMPNTQKDPGFGVRPARDNSPAELERVGVDYFNAMKSKYGNDTLAAIAYNMGPAKTDAWLKKGGNFKDLPKETQEYIPKVYLAQAQMDRQSGAPVSTARAEQAPRPTARRATQTIPEMEAELEARKEGLTEEFKGRGKSLVEKAEAIEDNAAAAPKTLASAKYIDKIATENPNIFGILQRPTVAAAFAKLVEKGISAGNTTISLSGLSDAIRRAVPGVTKDELIAVEKVGQQLAELKLTTARNFLKGQGAVSNFEREIVAEFTGSVDNSVEALKDFMAWNTMRAEYDSKVGDIYQRWLETGNNRNRSFQDFKIESREYRDATRDYRTQIGEFGGRGGLNYKAPRAEASKPSPTSGTTSGKLKWKVVE